MNYYSNAEGNDPPKTLQSGQFQLMFHLRGLVLHVNMQQSGIYMNAKDKNNLSGYTIQILLDS